MTPLLVKLGLLIVMAVLLKAAVTGLLKTWDQIWLWWMTRTVRPPDRFKLIWLVTVPLAWLLIATDRDYWRFRQLTGIGCWANNTRAFYWQFAEKRREFEQQHPDLRADRDFWAQAAARSGNEDPHDRSSSRDGGASNRSQARTRSWSLGQDAAEQMLGLSGSYDHDDLRAAYRSLTKVAHPDAGGHDAAMAQANAAYSLLRKIKGWT